jgi:hypothetical protein
MAKGIEEKLIDMGSAGYQRRFKVVHHNRSARTIAGAILARGIRTT